jgi:hypothetical protein
MAQGRQGAKRGRPAKGVVEAVGTAGAAGAKGLAGRIEEAMGKAAQKALADGASVEEQRKAMQAARKDVVKQAADEEARANQEVQARAAQQVQTRKAKVE